MWTKGIEPRKGSFRMVASKGLTFAMDLFGNNREITANGVRFDALAEEGMAHAEENNVHGKDHEHFL